jgi:hypothetical protein
MGMAGGQHEKRLEGNFLENISSLFLKDSPDLLYHDLNHFNPKLTFTP